MVVEGPYLQAAAKAGATLRAASAAAGGWDEEKENEGSEFAA